MCFRWRYQVVEPRTVCLGSRSPVWLLMPAGGGVAEVLPVVDAFVVVMEVTV